MPLQEFWYDDPDLLWAYRNMYMEKEKQKIEIERKTINFQSWLQGLYNFNAIVGALSKDPKYLDSPINLNSKPKTEKEIKMEIAQRIKSNVRKGKSILERQRSEKKG